MPRRLLLLAALLLAACAGRSDYHLMPPPSPAGAVSRAGGGLSVADVSLPTYAEAVEIAVLTGPGVLELAKNDLWADTPRRAVTRHLVAALQARLPNAKVATEPWPSFEGPALRLEVYVDRMVGQPGGPFRLAGQYLLVAPAEGRVVASERFAIDRVVAGDSLQALIDAHARAVESLADAVAARIARAGGLA